ncbi:MAG: hypothetical protein FWG89_07130 [Treponema sp.]|nr:hypothetical protein [Treponema sp.]
MKNLIFFVLIGAVLLTGTVLIGCASMQLDYLEEGTATGPAQVRQGMDINPREITVWGIYKNGKRQVVSISPSNITFNKHSPGPQEVKIRVGVLTTQETSFMTEVMALQQLTVATQPRVAIFKQGQTPDPAWPGIEIRGTWDSMGSQRVDLSSCVVTGFLPNQSGRQTIRVTFEGLQTTFDIDVRAMASMEITQPPVKLDYAQGDTLDLTGLRVVGIWEGFPSEELTVTMNDITGFNSNNVGIQRVVITRNDRTAFFDTEVMALTSIVVRQEPNKVNYRIGEPLDLSGIIVEGRLTGADPTKIREIIIPIDQLTVDGYDPNRPGRVGVTLRVRGQIANIFVNVVAE